MPTDRFEEGYVEGRRRSLINLLHHTFKELQESPPEVLKLVVERQEAIGTLRSLCRELGLPNDWPDDLHLSDIIEKRVVRLLKP